MRIRNPASVTLDQGTIFSVSYYSAIGKLSPANSPLGRYGVGGNGLSGATWCVTSDSSNTNAYASKDISAGGTTWLFGAGCGGGPVASFGFTNLTNFSSNFVMYIDGTTSTPAMAVGDLPIAGKKGRRSIVTDALAPTFGVAVAGGGSVTVPVYDTGTAWFVG